MSPLLRSFIESWCSGADSHVYDFLRKLIEARNRPSADEVERVAVILGSSTDDLTALCERIFKEE